MIPIRLHVQHLSKRFGPHRVFDDVSFDFNKGSLGIAGANGSGKSTLMQCLAGLLRPASGRLEWYKKERKIDMANIKKILGYAAPYINLYEELTCHENVAFLLKLRGNRDISNVIDTTLTKTGMIDFADHLFGNLSTGQQQRMRLAAAIIHEPEVLFLDEPGSNLDEQGRGLIEGLVTEFKEADKLVVIASNNPDELNLCDQVYSVEKEKNLP